MLCLVLFYSFIIPNFFLFTLLNNFVTFKVRLQQNQQTIRMLVWNSLSILLTVLVRVSLIDDLWYLLLHKILLLKNFFHVLNFLMNSLYSILLVLSIPFQFFMIFCFHNFMKIMIKNPYFLQFFLLSQKWLVKIFQW